MATAVFLFTIFGAPTSVVQPSNILFLRVTAEIGAPTSVVQPTMSRGVQVRTPAIEQTVPGTGNGGRLADNGKMTPPTGVGILWLPLLLCLF